MTAVVYTWTSGRARHEFVDLVERVPFVGELVTPHGVPRVVTARAYSAESRTVTLTLT